MAAKLALTVFLAKYFTLSDVGKYGLLQGLIGTTPAVFGVGINYFMARHLVGAVDQKIFFVLRDRLTLTFLFSLIGAGLLALVVNRLEQKISIGPIFFLLIVSECIALDVFQALIGLGRSFAANVLLFIRTALWVLLFMIFGILFSSYRTFDALILWWSLGNVFSVFCACIYLMRYRQPEILKTNFDFGWMKVPFLNWGMIYLADIAIVWQLYIDRFILGAFHTVEDVGRYTLYFALAGSVSLLVSSGIIQPSLNRFVSAFRADACIWAELIKSRLKLVIISFICIAGAALFTAFFLLPYFFEVATFRDGWLEVVLMLGAMFFRTLSDFVTLCFYAAENDRVSAGWNLFGILFSSGLVLLGAAFGNLLTVCFAIFCASLFLAFFRLLMLARLLRNLRIISN